jgi:hypothetical protein
MGVAQFVQNAFRSSLSQLSAEEVLFGNQIAYGVVEDLGAEKMLGEGGDNNQRELRISFPASAFNPVPKSRQKITCRAKTWEVTRVDNGPGSLVLDVIEPERRGS